jgi:hypothetical protein
MSTSKTDEKLLEQIRKHWRLAEDALQEIHQEALADFRFRAGDQWDKEILMKRKADGRPSYTINRIPEFVRQVTGQQKQNRPAIQISPVGDNSDVETAEVLQGLVRHIERTSNAEQAYDTAFDHMTTGGFGFIRLLTEYVDDETGDQEIKFGREVNPFSHYPDPRCKETDYSDARFWFVVEPMQKDDYSDEYPNSELAGAHDFAALANQAPGWMDGDSVRVAEYFWVECSYEEKKLKGGGTRQVERKSVHWCKTNGLEILDRAEIPGSYIPIVPVLGEDIRVDGRRYLVGIVRHARQPAQLYNLWQSAMAETIALAPKAPFMATPKQVEGFEEIWEHANSEAYPYLPYNPDEKAGGPPQRQFAEPPIQAITSALQHADNDLKTTTGLYDASLGAPGPEQSGKAILLRQKQGEAGTFGFQDSLKVAIQHAGRIIVGWIPTIYDAARVVRTVNPDGTSQVVPINQQFQDDDGIQKVFDVTVGRYDVAISSGPSYDSMRQEAAQSILQLVQAQPELMQVVGDLLVKCFDWPLAQEISERLKKMLPPQLQEPQANALPQAQAQLAQAQGLIQQLTAQLNAMSQKLQAKLPEIASRERIALINAKAGIIESALKAQSSEALAAFEADLAQIDRQLGMMPDPGMETATGGAPQQQPKAA